MTPLLISPTLTLPDEEIELVSIRAQGAGGQNVNKVSSAIHLRFDIAASSLPEACKRRLLDCNDRRINKDGIVVIKAQRHRTREKNRAEALDRLRDLIRAALQTPKRRVPTRAPRRAREQRLDKKERRSRTKQLRGRVTDT